ncbi:MAG TPA: hypothetical protein PLL77_10930 [Pyrinomonadaceae bacterium]|nr:hypothetical protein [Pyrinomonadaceae bacterium]
MSEIAIQLPSKSEFLAVNNSIFTASNGEGKDFEICLVSVEEIVSNDFQENFTLLFRAEPDVGTQQGIYVLKHEELGEMDLFLVPIKKDETGLYFEAVFNLIKAAGA